MGEDISNPAIAACAGAAVKKASANGTLKAAPRGAQTLALAAFGWFVPGGAYLLMRRYAQFAIFASAVTAAVVAGVALQGGSQWPRPEELAGLDGFTSLLFQAGAAAKFLAGAPFLAASAVHDAGGFMSSRVHEYGSVLLVMAGVMNTLGVSSALDQKEG
jgi:hypothetical protein